MSFSDYSGLKTAIQNWSKRDDVGNMIADFIRLTEIKIDETLQLRVNEKRAIARINTSDRFIALPRGFVEMRSLRILHAGKWSDVFFKVPETLNVRAQKGTPYFYTVNHQLEFDCIPDQRYTLEMTYYLTLDPLSDENKTNTVLQQYPDLYLYGALAELYTWARDEENAAYYEMMFEKKSAAAKRKEKRGRYGSAPSVTSTGPTP